MVNSKNGKITILFESDFVGHFKCIILLFILSVFVLQVAERVKLSKTQSESLERAMQVSEITSIGVRGKGEG